MCLSVIYGEPSRTAGYGYKLMEDCGRGWYKPLTGRGDLRVRKWETALGPYRNMYSVYPMDFHIFTRRREAERDRRWWPFSCPLVLVRVEYREAHTVGVDAGSRVVVAKQMRILGKVKECNED